MRTIQRRLILKYDEVVLLSEMLIRKDISIKILKRCKCLLLLSSGKKLNETSRLLDISYGTALSWRKLYLKHGVNYIFLKKTKKGTIAQKNL